MHRMLNIFPNQIFLDTECKQTPCVYLFVNWKCLLYSTLFEFHIFPSRFKNLRYNPELSTLYLCNTICKLLIFLTISPLKSDSQRLKSQIERFATSGCKNIEIEKLKFL